MVSASGKQFPPKMTSNQTTISAISAIYRPLLIIPREKMIRPKY